MQNPTPQNPTPQTRSLYRERLTPSLWLLVSAAVAGPMVSLTFIPVGGSIALLLGVAAALLILIAFVAVSPRVSVEAGWLRAGRARIDVRWLDDAVALTGDEARNARGPGLSARGWHLIRGGIDAVVVVQNIDPSDPVASWTISSRTPDRLAAAIMRARRDIAA